MTLGFEEAIKALDERIEILKQNLSLLMANPKAENTAQIITSKRELDKAVQKRMKLSQISLGNNNKRVILSDAIA